MFNFTHCLIPPCDEMVNHRGLLAPLILKRRCCWSHFPHPCSFARCFSNSPLKATIEYPRIILWGIVVKILSARSKNMLFFFFLYATALAYFEIVEGTPEMWFIIVISIPYFKFLPIPHPKLMPWNILVNIFCWLLKALAFFLILNWCLELDTMIRSWLKADNVGNTRLVRRHLWRGNSLRHWLFIRPPQQWEVRVFQIAAKVEGTKGMSVTW